MRRLVWCIAAILAALPLTGRASAHGAIGHYAISRAMGWPHEMAGLSELPDAWNEPVVVSDGHTWSHTTQRTGTYIEHWNVQNYAEPLRTIIRGLLAPYGDLISIPLPIPNVPVYANDRRDPGRVIYCMSNWVTTGKLRTANWSEGELESAQLTARGFVAHNAMDSVVHFSYFEGGTFEKWYIHHALKEEWADNVLWRTKGGMSFHANGKAKVFWEIADVQTAADIIPLNCDTGAMHCSSRIIRLAEEVARKSRQMMDFASSSGTEYNPYTIVESAGVIAERISKLHSKLNADVKATTLARVNDLVTLGASLNWLDADVEANFEASQTRALDWLDMYCP